MRGLACVLLLCAPLAAQDETEVLVERVKVDLAAVDEALLEVADAEAVDEPLAEARRAHLRAIQSLEELIQSVKYRRMNPPPSGGGGGGSSSSSSMPQGDPQSQPSDGSSAPDPRDQSAQQAQQEQQGQGQPREGDGQQPRSGQPDGSEGRNEEADGPPPESETRRFTRDNADGRWGLLPPKLQERLINLHVNDLPERYRSQLEAYIQALRELEQP